MIKTKQENWNKILNSPITKCKIEDTEEKKNIGFIVGEILKENRELQLLEKNKIFDEEQMIKKVFQKMKENVHLLRKNSNTEEEERKIKEKNFVKDNYETLKDFSVLNTFTHSNFYSPSTPPTSKSYTDSSQQLPSPPYQDPSIHHLDQKLEEKKAVENEDEDEESSQEIQKETINKINRYYSSIQSKNAYHFPTQIYSKNDSQHKEYNSPMFSSNPYFSFNKESQKQSKTLQNYHKTTSSSNSDVIFDDVTSFDDTTEDPKKKSKNSYDFNREFQMCIDSLRFLKNFPSIDLSKEILSINSSIIRVSSNFVSCAKRYGKIIISELHLRNESKTIKPVDIGFNFFFFFYLNFHLFYFSKRRSDRRRKIYCAKYFVQICIGYWFI